MKMVNIVWKWQISFKGRNSRLGKLSINQAGIYSQFVINLNTGCVYLNVLITKPSLFLINQISTHWNILWNWLDRQIIKTRKRKNMEKSLIRHWAIYFQTIAACFTSFIAITNSSTDYIRKKKTTKKLSFNKEKKFRNNKNSAMIIFCFSITLYIKTKTTI